MAKNRLVSLCTSWSLRYPPCLISLITNKLAANSVTIADFIVIPTCFFSRREVEKWSTLRTRFFFVCWRFKRPFFFCKAHDYWRTWAAGKNGTKNNAISFWSKSTLSSKFGVCYIRRWHNFFFSVVRLCQRELTDWWHKNERNNWYSPCMDLFMSPLYSKNLIR